jgi:hypothetical protein
LRWLAHGRRETCIAVACRALAASSHNDPASCLHPYRPWHRQSYRPLDPTQHPPGPIDDESIPSVARPQKCAIGMQHNIYQRTSQQRKPMALRVALVPCSVIHAFVYVLDRRTIQVTVLLAWIFNKTLRLRYTMPIVPSRQSTRPWLRLGSFEKPSAGIV